MRWSAARAGVGVLVLGGAAIGLAPPAAAGEPGDDSSSAPVVVATGLDNPRQLSRGSDSTLLVAEAGSGGDTCLTLPLPPNAPLEEQAETICGGLTGGIAAIGSDGSASRVVDGLFSIAGPDGSSAVGSNGVAATDVAGEYLVAETDALLPPEVAGAPGAEQLGHLVVAVAEGSEQFLLPYADIAAEEEALNPDGAQIESNPYAVLFVDPTPDGPLGADGYALVTDAAANTVWRIEPDFAAVPATCVGDACLPPYAITVFATFPTPADDDVTPEYVPTSLATDGQGNVYVGGLGSGVTGAAEVRQFTADGEEIAAWGGFTGITGLAVDEAGEHLYVSQLLGSIPDSTATAPPGNVVDVDVAAGTYRSVDVPFPGGVAPGEDGAVYVAAFSVAPATGTPDTPAGPGLPSGQVWEISFDDSESVGLPTFFPLDTGGQFVPAQTRTSPLPDVCGGIFLAPGDLAGEWRVTRDEAGDRIQFRGAATLDVLGPDQSVLIDELDVSGAGFESYPADGSAEFSYDGPNLVYAFPEEVDAFAAAGLPPISSYTSGTFADVISPAGEVEVTSVPDDAVDLCTLLPAR